MGADARLCGRAAASVGKHALEGLRGLAGQVGAAALDAHDQVAAGQLYRCLLYTSPDDGVVEVPHARILPTIPLNHSMK